jgi:hypothetical protein
MYLSPVYALNELEKAKARARGLDLYEYAMSTPPSDRVLWQTPSKWRDVEAAGAEVAVSGYLGKPWTRHANGAKADVGERIQVRCSNWGLRIYERDRALGLFDHAFVWARPLRPGVYELVGWLPGHELWEAATAVDGALRDGTLGRILRDRGKLIPIEKDDPRLR